MRTEGCLGGRLRGAAAVALYAAATGIIGWSSPVAARTPDCEDGCVTAFATPGHAPFGVSRGPDGEEWISLDGTLGAFASDGQRDAVAIATSNPNAGWITSDHHGGLWFAERNSGFVGHMNERHAIREYPLGGPNAVPQGIVVLDDGTVYVTEQGRNAIARLDPGSGTVTEHVAPTPRATVLGLALGADGALWFTERSAGKIGRMRLDGTFTEYALSSGAFPVRIVAGPDGALWFTELKANLIGRMTTDGGLTEYPDPGGPSGITVGPHRELYVVDNTARELSRYNLGGRRTGTWALPGATSPVVVSPGHHDDLWVTDPFSAIVFHVQLGGDDE